MVAKSIMEGLSPSGLWDFVLVDNSIDSGTTLSQTHYSWFDQIRILSGILPRILMYCKGMTNWQLSKSETKSHTTPSGPYLIRSNSTINGHITPLKQSEKKSLRLAHQKKNSYPLIHVCILGDSLMLKSKLASLGALPFGENPLQIPYINSSELNWTGQYTLLYIPLRSWELKKHTSCRKQ